MTHCACQNSKVGTKIAYIISEKRFHTSYENNNIKLWRLL
jgi:hypothetical protein